MATKNLNYEILDRILEEAGIPNNQGGQVWDETSKTWVRRTDEFLDRKRELNDRIQRLLDGVSD